MTDRKPPGTSYESWVDLQVRRARERGDLDNLPGEGKPLPDTGRPFTVEQWMAEKLRRENVDVASVLPPSLALAKEVEDLPLTLAALRTEAKVREHLDDLNRRIRKAFLGPQDGPPMRTQPVDVEETVADWHASRTTAPN